MKQELWLMAECSCCCRVLPLWCLLGSADTPVAKVWKHFLWVCTFAVGVLVPGTALGQGRQPCPCPLARQWTAALGSFPAAAESNSVKYSFSLVHTNISPLELRCARSSASVRASKSLQQQGSFFCTHCYGNRLRDCCSSKHF